MRDMAPRSTTKKKSSKPARKKTSEEGVEYPEDLDASEVARSRKAAVLQLRMGRSGHVLGIASGLALAVTAVLAYLLENWDFLVDAPDYVTLLKWIVPMVAGLAAAIVALAMKWEPYFADRAEPHFLMSFAAVGVSAAFLAVIVLDELGHLAVGRPDWLYPASLLGISLTLISLAMTWEGTSRRKLISIVSAIFPPLLLFFPMLFRFTELELASILPMAYLGSAVAVQLSGSMLHIIASSTSVQEREVLKASDGKLRIQFEDVEKRQEALEYREDAMRSRESDLEAYEKRLAEELATIEERKREAEAVEVDLEQRVVNSRKMEEELARKEADVEGKLDTLRLRQADIDIQKKETEKLAKSVTAKEEKLTEQEAELEKKLLDAHAKERDAKNKLAEFEAQEAELSVWTSELESQKNALEDRERQISAREGSLDVKSLEILAAKEHLGQVAAEKNVVKGFEQQLLMRQESLSEREITVKAREAELKKASERAQRMIERSDKQLNELVDKENALLEKEKALAGREAQLRAAMASLDTQTEELESAKSIASRREKEYSSLSDSAKAKMATLMSKEQEISRKMTALEKREENLKLLDDRMKVEQSQMNSKLRALLEKEKDLKAAESKVSLKSAELRAMERDMLRSVDDVEEVRTVPSVDEADMSKAVEARERRLVEKEREMKSRLYQREKELEKREKALQLHLRKDLEEMETEVETEYVQEKIKTGMERLDDLLLGGMPFSSNVLFAGPPFIGKETAMLIFIADGIRKGVPAIIITTSRPPVEIAKDMAPILPTFVEFEQLGLVKWIDASGLPEDSESSRDNVLRVNGPDDYAGILKALDKAVKSALASDKSYYRLAFFTLSMSMTGGDEKKSFQFVQELTSRVRQSQAIAVYAVERGMHTEQQLNSIQHQMTGAIQFKTEKQKTLLSVEGVCDTQTRGWVDYKHTNKAVMIGAFSLERIR